MKEILASTCYLTLCLRRISNRAFIGIFVRFILTHTFEDICILDSLISRLSAQTDLRLATLQLFNALVDLNCEDVMLALTMKHLLPGSHVMLSQRSNSVQVRFFLLLENYFGYIAKFNRSNFCVGKGHKLFVGSETALISANSL